MRLTDLKPINPRRYKGRPGGKVARSELGPCFPYSYLTSHKPNQGPGIGRPLAKTKAIARQVID